MRMKPQCRVFLPDGTRCKKLGKTNPKWNRWMCEKHWNAKKPEFAEAGQWYRGAK